MNVFDPDEMQKITEIMEFLLSTKSNGFSVRDIRKRYDLNKEEYNMIYDLTMPALRQMSGHRFYKFAFSNIYNKLTELEVNVVDNPQKLTDSELLELAKKGLKALLAKATSYMGEQNDISDEQSSEVEEAE